MKKVCSGGFTDLVLEVLNNTLPIASNPPTPPKQLLDLIVYGSSFIGFPTPIITNRFCGIVTKMKFICNVLITCMNLLHNLLLIIPN